MEVHGSQPSDPQPAKERFLRNQDLLREATRDRVRRARAGLAHIEAQRRQQVRDTRLPDGDVIDISTRHQVADEERAAKVDEMKRLHDEGRLATPERIDRAAERILSGE